MLIGARTGAWAKSGGGGIPYVNDGLIALYDAKLSSHSNSVFSNAVSSTVSDIDLTAFESGSAANISLTWHSNRLSIETLTNSATVIFGIASLGSATIDDITLEACVSSSNLESFDYWTSFLSSDAVPYIGWGRYGVGSLIYAVPSSNSRADACLYSSSVTQFTTACACKNTTNVYNKCYLDGSLVNPSRYWGFNKSSSLPTYFKLYAAKAKIGSIVNIHSLRAYNRLLSDEEVASNSAVDRERFSF